MFVDGAWRITVVGKDADFDQRVVVRTPYGVQVLAGVAGESLVVDADTWELRPEHLWPGRGWRPDVEVVPGPVTVVGGRRTREVRARDCYWAEHPRSDAPRNLVLRLAALGAEAPRRAAAGAEAIGPAATPLVRTSSGPASGPLSGPGTGRGAGSGSGRGSAPAAAPAPAVVRSGPVTPGR
ncbi:hypothetical protein AB0O91_11665 [Kitasatospora sp. NPDC089797]|uniref:hypothetical protein n=1 Tax=Kitasatospora sp. NPDC089797 TaxID=3155298 RepID=UPI00343997A3